MTLRKTSIIIGLAIAVLSAVRCIEVKNDYLADSNGQEYISLDYPKGFPEIEVPKDNKLTKQRVALGKKMFFDPALSLDSSISCASCHLPEKAFSDTIPISPGVHGRNGIRNTPSLVNIGYTNIFFRDGGARTLELQALSPIQTEEEMDLNIVELVERLKKDPEYVRLSKEAYDREPDPFVITRALGAFQRTLISGNSRYDQFKHGDKSALSAAEQRGMELFFGKRLNCASCHSGFNFSNDRFENNGLYAHYADSGRARITFKSSDAGKFKVPSLRNIGVTNPYMHNGSFRKLSEVIDHYAAGGAGHPLQSDKIKGFEITPQEKEDLILFLEALTDEAFLKDPRYRMDG